MRSLNNEQRYLVTSDADGTILEIARLGKDGDLTEMPTHLLGITKIETREQPSPAPVVPIPAPMPTAYAEAA